MKGWDCKMMGCKEGRPLSQMPASRVGRWGSMEWEGNINQSLWETSLLRRPPEPLVPLCFAEQACLGVTWQTCFVCLVDWDCHGGFRVLRWEAAHGRGTDLLNTWERLPIFQSYFYRYSLRSKFKNLDRRRVYPSFLLLFLSSREKSF